MLAAHSLNMFYVKKLLLKVSELKFVTTIENKLLHSYDGGFCKAYVKYDKIRRVIFITCLISIALCQQNFIIIQSIVPRQCCCCWSRPHDCFKIIVLIRLGGDALQTYTLDLSGSQSLTRRDDMLPARFSEIIQLRYESQVKNLGNFQNKCQENSISVSPHFIITANFFMVSSLALEQIHDSYNGLLKLNMNEEVMALHFFTMNPNSWYNIVMTVSVYKCTS